MGYVLDSRPTGALFRVGGTLTVALVLTTDFTYGVLRSIEINILIVLLNTTSASTHILVLNTTSAGTLL